MAVQTQRSRITGRRTFNVLMSSQDTVKNTQAGWDVDTNGQPVLYNQAGTIIQQFASASYAGPQLVKLGTVTGGAASSGVFGSFANPLGYALLITKLIIVVTTVSTGAATIDAGIAADATTSNDGMIDGASVATGAVILDNQKNAGTNGRGAQTWSTTQFLNVAEASGDVDAFVGTVYAEVVRAV